MTESDILYPVIDTRTIQYNNYFVDSSSYFVEFYFDNYFIVDKNVYDGFYKVIIDLDITDSYTGSMVNLQSINMMGIGEIINISGVDTASIHEGYNFLYKLMLMYNTTDKKLIIKIASVMDNKIREVVDIRNVRVRKII